MFRYSKKILINLMLVKIVIILMLVLFEFTLRIIHPYNDTNPVPIAEHNVLPYIMLPNTNSTSIDGINFIIDDAGLRDIKPGNSGEKQTNTFLVIGDSTTFGYGVSAEDTFVERLQYTLNTQNSSDYSLINAGHSGFNLKNYADLLELLTQNLHVDGLIFGIMGNDFTNTDLDYVFRGSVGISESSPLNRFKVPENIIKILRKSALYLTVGNAVKGFNFKRTQLVQQNSFDNNNIIASINHSLQKIKIIVQQQNLPVFIFYLPTKGEILNNKMNYSTFGDILTQFSTENANVVFYDLTKDNRISSRVDELYFETDWVHPNEYGHEAYCNVILEQIKINSKNSQSFPEKCL